MTEHKFFQVVCVILGLMAAVSLSAQERIRLSLIEAFDMIEEENLQVLIQRQDVEQAFIASVRDRSDLLPHLSFDISQVRAQYVNAGRGFGELPTLPPASRFEGKLSATMPLIDVARFTTWRVSKFDHEISELAYEDVLQDVLNATAEAYITHLRNVRRIEVLDANIERDRVLLDLAQNQFQAGVATQIDVTRAEVALASDQKERIQQDTAVLESELRVKLLLNLDLDAGLELVMLDAYKPTPKHAYYLSVESILEDRPDYQQALRVLERNRVARKLAGFETLPSINLFGEWGVASERIFDGNSQEAWLTGISVSVPLFEGFRIKSNKQSAEILIRSQEYFLEDMEQQVGADYRLAVQDVESRYEQISFAQKRVELNEEEVSLARTRFVEGVADNREVIDAQADLALANDALIETVYQYNLSRLTLARIRGDVRMVLTD